MSQSTSMVGQGEFIVEPFATRLGDFLVVDRSFDTWRRQVSAALAPAIEKEGLRLHWDAQTFCTEGLLHDFVTKALRAGVPAEVGVQVGKIHEAFGPNATGLSNTDDPLRYPLRLVKGRAKVSSPNIVKISQTGEFSERLQPGRMSEPILMPFEPEFVWRIGHWSDLLTVNLLMLQVTLKGIAGDHRGRDCSIHPTAVVEESHFGDRVTIEPFAIVQNSVIADGVTIQEYGSVINAVVGPGSVVQTHAQVRESVVGENTVVSFQTSMRNSVLLGNSTISASVVVRSVVGKNVFLSRGLEIAATTLGDDPIPVWIDGKRINSGQRMLGCAIGDGARIGGGLHLPPGYEVPSGYHLASRPLGRLATDLSKGTPLIEIDGNFRRLSFARRTEK